MAAVPPRKRLKRLARYMALRGLWAVCGILPFGLALRLGEALGALAFAILRRDRERAQESIALAFTEAPELERRALARKSFRHLGRSAMELSQVRRIDRRMASFVEFPAEDRQALEGALSRGKGVVFVSGHVGNWELLARRVAFEGFACQSIAKETTDPRTTALVERIRAEGKVRSIWRGDVGAAKQMLRALRAGEILGLVIDQDTQVQSVFVPFFGRLAATPRAAADLALRTGAALMVGFCQRQPDGRHRLFIREVPVEASEDRERDVVRLTSALSAEIELAIRRAPEQWVWLHRRWRTQPKG